MMKTRNTPRSYGHFFLAAAFLSFDRTGDHFSINFTIFVIQSSGDTGMGSTFRGWYAGIKK